MKKNHFKRAVEYIRQNLEQYEIEKAWTYIGRRMGLPNEIEDKIRDLLDDYGEDYDLGEDWWYDEYDIEDFFMEIES